MFLCLGQPLQTLVQLCQCLLLGLQCLLKCSCSVCRRYIVCDCRPLLDIERYDREEGGEGHIWNPNNHIHTHIHTHTHTHRHTISLPFFSKLLYVAPCFGHAVELLVHDRRTDVATPSPLEQLGGLGLDPLQGTLLEGYLLLDLLVEGEGEGSGRVMT